MPKMKVATKTAKIKKTKTPAEDHEESRERHTAEKVMQTVLAEHKAESEVRRLDQWVSIECPHCGEAGELHVIAEMDGQSIDQNCMVCCRAFVAHVEVEEDEAHVGVEAA